MTAVPSFPDWLKAKLSTNWCVARRTARIVERYGPDVVTLSQARYKALQAEYRASYGAPHDPRRAALYRALVKARRALPCSAASGLIAEIDAALEAERTAR